jgi:hypothetical protein
MSAIHQYSNCNLLQQISNFQVLSLHCHNHTQGKRTSPTLQFPMTLATENTTSYFARILHNNHEVNSFITVTKHHVTIISSLSWCIEWWWHSEALQPGFNHSKILLTIQKHMLAVTEKKIVLGLVNHCKQHADSNISTYLSFFYLKKKKSI